MSMSRLEAVLASIDEQADQAQGKLDKAAEFAARSEHLQVPGESADGLVTVVVDGSAQVVDVRFDDDFDTASAAELSADVMAALAQARRRLSFRIEELGTEIYGEHSPTAQMFADSYRDRFGYEEI